MNFCLQKVYIQVTSTPSLHGLPYLYHSQGCHVSIGFTVLQKIPRLKLCSFFVFVLCLILLPKKTQSNFPSENIQFWLLQVFSGCLAVFLRFFFLTFHQSLWPASSEDRSQKSELFALVQSCRIVEYLQLWDQLFVLFRGLGDVVISMFFVVGIFL